MRSQLARLKANLIVGKLVLLLVNFLLILALGEWLFPKFLDKIPLRLYGSIENNLRILAQHSKKNLLPNVYIAIVGDSIAVGSGDWLEEVRKNSFFGSPDYSPAHLINEKTGIDVVSFAQGGVGSFGGIWKEPITQFLYINSVKNYQLSPPKYLLIFFSESGDIYDNVGFLRGKLLSIQKGSMKKKTELNEVLTHLNHEFKKVLDSDYDKSLWKNMLFIRSTFKGVLNLVEEFASLNKNHPFLFSFPKTPINLALINGKQTPLPMHLQGPSLFATNFNERLKEFYITEEEYKLGLYVFEQALAALIEFFPQTEIKVVFNPSPLSSYQIVSPKVSFRGYMQKESLVDTVKIKKRHAKLCEAIRGISLVRKVSFLNTTKSLRKAASQEFMHGPVDWDHFNKAGYETLPTYIAETFLKSGAGVRTDNCVY